MSTIDLIILGYLYDQDRNSYELATHISDKNINRFLKISTPAVYKRSKALFEEGYLDGKTIKHGTQPGKTIYRTNKKGKELFIKLMGDYSSHINPFYIDCNVFLWNIDKLKNKQALKMLINMRNEFLNLKKWIILHEKDESPNLTFSAKSIVKQYRMTITTLLEWSEEVLKDFKKMDKS